MKRVTVLFENDSCIVLNKPAGLAVQGGAGVTVSLDSILREEFSPAPLLVHRLDRDTSGLILVAKNHEAAIRFSRIFAGSGNERSPGERPIMKRYLAICSGSPVPEAGCIRLELEVRGTRKPSETTYRLLESRGAFSRLELELGTGRTHQIRRHLAGAGCPVLGDDKYGDFALNRELRKTRHVNRLLLHASHLSIVEEAAGFPLDITAPPPDYFERFWNHQ